MIVYNSTKKDFVSDVRRNIIADKILASIREHHLFAGQHSEYVSWQNSLNFICNVVDTPSINNDTEVSIEYQIPHTSKRVDFIISGSNEEGEDHIVVVELKAWQQAEKVNDASRHTVRTFTGGDYRLVNHPSYQAYSYATFIKNFSEIVQNDAINIKPCVYLHNYETAFNNELNDSIYQDWINEAPFFTKTQFDDLQSFITKYVKYQSKDKQLLYRIDHGRIRPSKALQDSLASVMRGNKEFLLLDDQATAFDICVNAMEQCKKDQKRRTVIIQGGPGTGKSVLAINLLKHFIDQSYNAAYLTKNTAPRKAYLKLLTDSNVHKEMNISPLFRSPFGLSKARPLFYDCLIIDEAHRLVKKMYGDFTGENQVKECINASLLSVFLIDEDQQIIRSDIGSIDEIKLWSQTFRSEVIMSDDTILKSQFRCNGSDAYIQLVNQILQIGESITVNTKHLDYDIRLFRNPNEMRNQLRSINSLNNKSRMVAGYCYDWNVKNKRGEWDIFLENDFKAKWNLTDDDTWAVSENSFEEVGCIHTAQGLEFDYVGVIIGRDLTYDNKTNQVKTNQSAISQDDKSSKIRSAPSEEAKRLIKNTYKTLLTRGQKGCFIYCEDPALADYIETLIGDK